MAAAPPPCARARARRSRSADVRRPKRLGDARDRRIRSRSDRHLRPEHRRSEPRPAAVPPGADQTRRRRLSCIERRSDHPRRTGILYLPGRYASVLRRRLRHRRRREIALVELLRRLGSGEDPSGIPGLHSRTASSPALHRATSTDSHSGTTAHGVARSAGEDLYCNAPPPSEIATAQATDTRNRFFMESSSSLGVNRVGASAGWPSGASDPIVASATPTAPDDTRLVEVPARQRAWKTATGATWRRLDTSGTKLSGSVRPDFCSVDYWRIMMSYAPGRGPSRSGPELARRESA